MTGTRGEQSELSWSVYGGYDRYRNGDEGTSTTFAVIQQNTRFGALRAGYDQGKTIVGWRWAPPGPLVLHSGGVTLRSLRQRHVCINSRRWRAGRSRQNGQGR
jgi:outer membrane usher protein